MFWTKFLSHCPFASRAGRQPTKIHFTRGGMFRGRLGLRFDIEVSVIGADRQNEVVQEALEPG